MSGIVTASKPFYLPPLSDQVMARIAEKVRTLPPLSALGYITFRRTYSRHTVDGDVLSPMETFDQMLVRLVRGCKHQLGMDLTDDQCVELFTLMYKRKFLPAGRFLHQLGTRMVADFGLFSLQNCAAIKGTSKEMVETLEWIFMGLMYGTGVGVNIEEENFGGHAVKILTATVEHICGRTGVLRRRRENRERGVSPEKPVTADEGLAHWVYVVPDSREGWAELLTEVLRSHIIGARFAYSTYKLRATGTPIKRFGGRASGPGPLVEAMETIHAILQSLAMSPQPYLTPCVFMDLVCTIGECVRKGNVRRTALIHGGSWTDRAFIRSKRWDICWPKDGEALSTFLCTDLGTELSMLMLAVIGSTLVWELDQLTEEAIDAYADILLDGIRTSTGGSDVELIMPHSKLVSLMQSRSPRDANVPCTPIPNDADSRRAIRDFVEGPLMDFQRTERSWCAEVSRRVWYHAYKDFGGRSPDQLLAREWTDAFRSAIQVPNFRSNTNNSVICSDTSLLPPCFWEGYRGNGEPFGLINLDLCRSAGRTPSDPSRAFKSVMVPPEERHSDLAPNGHVWTDRRACEEGFDNDYEGEDGPPDCPGLWLGELDPDERPTPDHPDPDVERFLALGPRVADVIAAHRSEQPDPTIIMDNPCGEQPLANGETCCLMEIMIANIRSLRCMLKCAKYAYMIAKHSLRLPCALPLSAKVITENMRMGIGAGSLAMATDRQKMWLTQVAGFLAFLDTSYSASHGWPQSIRMTTVKPSGTLSTMLDVTFGCHPGFALHYKRNISFSKQFELLDALKDSGHAHEPALNLDGTARKEETVVWFPCKLPDDTPLAENVSAVDQLTFVEWIQHRYSNNAVSCTVYYRLNELPEIIRYLKERYTRFVKGISFLLHSEHGYVQPVYAAITQKQFETMRSGIDLERFYAISNEVEDERSRRKANRAERAALEMAQRTQWLEQQHLENCPSGGCPVD